MRPQSLLLVALLACATGCAPTELGVPQCPNPVLLGPVDRVGGHRARPAKTVATVEGEVEDFVAASTDTQTVGNSTITTTTTTAYSALPSPITNRVLMGTEGRADRDVRIDEVKTGAWAYFLFTYAAASRWSSLRGRVVSHDR